MPEEVVSLKQNHFENSPHSFCTEKQPRMLYLLCLTELFERFGHYVMRGILVLYMSKILLFSNDRSYAIFAGFSALLYLAPFLGGHLADKILGTKRAILVGGILLTLGYGLLAVPGTKYFYDALAIIVAGSGFFIPNMAGIVGQLYEKNDARREGGFSIFYAGINLGALIPPIIIASVIFKFGWHAGFFLASIVVLFGTLIFYFSLRNAPYVGETPELKQNYSKKILQYFLIALGTLLLISFFSELIKKPDLANKIVFTSGACFFVYAFRKSFDFPKTQRDRLFVCFFLTLFSVIFEVLLQQTAMSMTIFVEDNVQRNLNSWVMPTVMFHALNPFFIILCAPLFAKMWLWLDRRNFNPSVPTKFAYGTLLIGAGFVILPFAISQSSTGKIGIIWIVLSYFLQSSGELLVSPVGLSLITEMSPRNMVGLMMGLWYFATAVANSIAGIVSQWTIVAFSVNNPIITAPAYAQTFGMLGVISIIAGVMAFAAIPRLKSMLSVKNEVSERSHAALPSLNLSSS